MKIRILATYLILGIIGAGCASTPKINTTKLPDEIRAQQVKDMKFGMFVCWSFSTFSGHEWTPTLDKDASYFKATGCDTDQWCQTAKAAGMNYILFLSKHHDGFCLWDTATTDKKVTNSPLGIDVLAKLRKSCDKYGIKLALYFSEGDWNWPGAVDGKGRKAGAGINPDMKKAQLKELLTNYGPIEFWWMDHAVGTGGLSHEETVDWVHKFQPNSFVGFPNGQPAGRIVLRERGRPGKIGDTSASFYGSREEQYKGYLAAEFTYPILPKHKGGAGWFYSLPKHDNLCKPAESLYNDYVGALKYGNIFSIDVGPNYEGRLRDIDVKTLRQVGEMIKSGSSALQTESANGQARNRAELTLGMVAIPVLKTKVGMSDEQIKKVRKLYKSFRPRAEEAMATIKDANDKDAANRAAQPLREEMFDAVRAICTPEQMAKFNKYLAARRAKLRHTIQSNRYREEAMALKRHGDLNHDIAPAMKVKSRKLVFRADPKGLDWAARGSLTKTKTGRWIATYTQATQHGRAVPPLPTRLVVVHTSDDEGRTWSKPNCLPDGTSVTGAPLRAEHGHVEPGHGGVLTCPNGDLLYLSMSKDHDGIQWHQGRTIQWRSTDNGASWNYEGRSPGVPAGVKFSLGKTVEGGSIYVTVYGFPASKTDGSNKSNQLLTEEFFQTMLYRSDDNALTWKKVSVYGTTKDRINETGVVCVDENTIMVVCRSGNETFTSMRISHDKGQTWGPMTVIGTGVPDAIGGDTGVGIVQQPKLTKFPEEPGRIYLTGRERILEFTQRNCLWYTDDGGRTWKMKPVDDAFFRDSGYGEILKRKDGDLYYLGYRGTDFAADSWEFVLKSDYKVKRVN